MNRGSGRARYWRWTRQSVPVVDLTMALVDLIGMTVGGASFCSGICETARREYWMLFFLFGGLCLPGVYKPILVTNGSGDIRWPRSLGKRQAQALNLAVRTVKGGR